MPRSTTLTEREELNKIRLNHDGQDHENCDVCYLLNLITILFQRRNNRSFSANEKLRRYQEGFHRGDPGHPDNEMGM